MNKDLIINKIVKDLPIKEMRSQMSDVEWFGWFEEVWDKAINNTYCCSTLCNKNENKLGMCNCCGDNNCHDAFCKGQRNALQRLWL